MLLTNALQLAGITAAYFALFLLLPYWLFHMSARKGPFLHKLFFVLCASTAQMALSVYLLAFIGLFSFWPLLVLCLIESLVIYLLARKLTVGRQLRRVFFFIMHVHDGYYKPRVMTRKLIQRVSASVYRTYTLGFRRQPIWVLCIAACFGYGIWVRMLPVLEHAPYGVTDLYVYTEWIKAMFEGKIFLSGVYFYGMHNVVAGMTTLFGLNVVTVLRMLGVAYTILTMLGVYWVLTLVFDNKWSVLVALAVYGCLQTFVPNTYFRHSYALAQEFSQLFWIVASAFFIRLLDQRNRHSLYGFSLALLCIVLSHYYGLLVAAIFCIVYFLVYIRRIMANHGHLFKQLAGAVAFAFVVGLLPLAVGLLMGIPLEGSFLWGLGMMREGSQAVAATTDSLGYFQRVLRGFDALAQPLSYYVERSIPLLLSLVLSIIMTVRRSTRRLGMRVLGLSLFQGAMFILMIAGPLGLPALLDQWRSAMFFTMLGCALYAVPLEFIASLGRRLQKQVAALCAAVLIGVIGWRYGLKHPIDLEYAQWEGAMVSYYKILNEHPRGTWTIVSPVEETSLVRGNGYHYELYDFLADMDVYDPSIVIDIPTRYVFFYVEKVPLNYELIENPGADPHTPLTEEEARPPIATSMKPLQGNVPYIEYPSRRILESKLNAWATKYRQYFPDDMTVYYEDDEMIVYRVVQNTYAPMNFAIDYGYNPYRGDGEGATP